MKGKYYTGFREPRGVSIDFAEDFVKEMVLEIEQNPEYARQGYIALFGRECPLAHCETSLKAELFRRKIKGIEVRVLDGMSANGSGVIDVDERFRKYVENLD